MLMAHAKQGKQTKKSPCPWPKLSVFSAGTKFSLSPTFLLRGSAYEEVLDAQGTCKERELGQRVTSVSVQHPYALIWCTNFSLKLTFLLSRSCL